MVGVAGVSDLTVLWVLLGVFVALPVAMRSPEPASLPIRQSRCPKRPSLTRPASALPTGITREQWLWKLAMAIGLVGMNLVLTWAKGISYPRAAVQAGHALEYSRQGDLHLTLAALDRAIGLAPNVPVYYNWRASVYTAFRRGFQGPREPHCDNQHNLSYEVCLVEMTSQSNLTGSNQRPFYYRSRLALANSARNLNLSDEAIRYYQESLNLVPGSWKLQNRLASVFIEQGNPGEALGLLQESLEITQDSDASTRAIVFRAMAYVDLGRELEAIDDLDLVLEANPNNVLALSTRALAHANLGQDAKALGDADRAVELGADRAVLELTLEEIRQRR